MKTKKLVLMSLFVALYVGLEMLDQIFGIFKMPQGGSLSFSIIVLIYASYLFGPKEAFQITVLAFVVRFIILPPTNVVHPIQFVFDFILAPGAYAFVVLVPDITLKFPIKRNSFKTTLPIGVLIAGLFQFMFHNISGWFYFSEYYQGNVIGGVMLYNFTYVLPTVVVAFILVMLSKRRMLQMSKNIF